MTPKTRSIPTLLALATLSVGCGIAYAQIYALDGVSTPIGSNDGDSHPIWDDVWSVAAPPYPLAYQGISYAVNPTLGFVGRDFVKHDHQYIAPYTPDPTRATITFHFATPQVVSGLEIIEHGNGVSKIEGFIGGNLASMVSIGNVFGQGGDPTGSGAFHDGEVNVFNFNNSVPASYFQFVVTKTPLVDGYAFFRSFPLDPSGIRYEGIQTAPAPVPEPANVAFALGMGLVAFAGFRSWRRLP